MLPARASLPILLALAAATAAPAAALAAQDVRVTVDGAPVFAEPTEESELLTHLREGDVVRVSERHREGWYKIRLPVPQGGRWIGWIESKDVSREAFPKDIDETGTQRVLVRSQEASRPFWTLLGYYDVLMITASDAQVASGLAESSFFAVTYGLELGCKVSRDWTIAITGGLHEYASFFAKGFLAGILLEYSYVNVPPWRLGIAAGIGGSLSTTISGRVAGENVVSQPFAAPAMEGKLTARWFPWPYFALEMEAGVRYITKSDVPLSTLAVDVDLFAPFIGGGLHLEF